MLFIYIEYKKFARNMIEPSKEIIPTNSKEKMAELPTIREGMLIANRSDTLLQEIIDIKLRTEMLPITMRKIYAYKLISIKKKLKEQKVIPLVLRKRMLYESVVSA